VLASILSAQIAVSAGFAWVLAAAAAAYGVAFLSLWRTPLTIDIKKHTVMHGR
jgi:hypothetical protein